MQTATLFPRLSMPRRMSVDHQILLLLANQVTKVLWPVYGLPQWSALMVSEPCATWAAAGLALSIWSTQVLRWRVLSLTALSRAAPCPNAFAWPLPSAPSTAFATLARSASFPF